MTAETANTQAATVMQWCDAIAEQFGAMQDQPGFRRDLRALAGEITETITGKTDLPARFHEIASTRAFQHFPEQIRTQLVTLWGYAMGSLTTSEFSDYDGRHRTQAQVVLERMHEQLLSLIKRYNVRANIGAHAGSSTRPAAS